MESGLFNSAELIDSLITDLNNGIKYLTSGNYVAWCQINAFMGQKLVELKKGVQKDLAGKDETIEDLKRQLHEIGVQVVDMDPQEFIDNMKEASDSE